YLQVGENRTASWIFRYERTVDGRRIEHMLGLGPVYTVSLAEARERACECRYKLLTGTDPLETRKAERAAAAIAATKTITFRECAEKYFNQEADRWNNRKARDQFLSSLQTYAFPVIGALPVAAIDVALVLRVLEPIWVTKPETAARVRARVEATLAWATVRGFRSGDNPARWRGHLSSALPRRAARVEHHAALPYLDLP